MERASKTLTWLKAHKLRVAALLLIALLLIPRPTQSQVLSPCCLALASGLSTIARTLTNVVGGGLTAIHEVMVAIDDFQRTVVWPEEAINRARGVAGAVRGIYNRIRGIAQIPVTSATLANPRRLEQTLLSRDPSRIGQTSGDYSAVYSAIPPPQDAPPEVRDLIDMTDAAAQAAMKRAIAIDALADQELAAAEQLGRAIQTAAPGSAPIIEAEATAWLVRANAYTQAALADLMRLRAIDLANAGAELKFGTEHSVETRQQIENILQKR